MTGFSGRIHRNTQFLPKLLMNRIIQSLLMNNLSIFLIIKLKIILQLII